MTSRTSEMENKISNLEARNSALVFALSARGVSSPTPSSQATLFEGQQPGKDADFLSGLFAGL